MTEGSLPPAGWYPEGNGQRFWDGQQWTDHRAPLQAAPLPLKSVGISYLLLLLLGGFGAHQFYLRNYGVAVGQILLWWVGWLATFVFVGFLMLGAVIIWWIIDLITLPGQTEQTNAHIRANGR